MEKEIVVETQNEETVVIKEEPATSTSTEDTSVVTSYTEGTSAFEEAKASIIAEYQPQLDSLRNENETLKHTIEQYKELLKGTQRTESAVDEVKPIVLPVYQMNWHKKG